jgi:putative ABC transport system permease protein
MNYSESLSTAVNALKSNKVRTVLTMLGIIIGVFSVVLLISLVRGVQNYVIDQFNAIGSNLVFVMPGRAGINRDPATSFTDNKLKPDYTTTIKTINAVEEAIPVITTGKTITYRGIKYFSAISGVPIAYVKIFDIPLEEGQFYTAEDDNTSRKVVVLGSAVHKRLFGTSKPLGEKIKIDTATFEVIGVLSPKGQDFDEQVVVPFNTAKNTFDVENIAYLVTKLSPDANVDESVKTIENILLNHLKRDDFTVMTQSDLLKSIQDILKILGFGLGAIAAISLLVGGIGIMNIMLVAVTERIREIGLRKAVGATSGEIAVQFLLESVLLSLIGGLIGLMLGYLASLGARHFIRTEVPIWAVLLSLGFSLLVGVVFGTYPAYKASRKEPIEALRYE